MSTAANTPSMREPTKADFVSEWGPAGYRENFDVYAKQVGATEEQVVGAGLARHFNKNHVALEIGCGGGFWSERHLCPNFKHVTGLDVLPGKPFSAPNFTYIELPDRNYSCYGIPDESIDFVWCFGVLCHLNLASIQTYLNSVYRVLKHGGTAVIEFSNNDRRPGMYSVEQQGQERGILWVKNDLPTTFAMINKAGFANPVDLMPQIASALIEFTKA